MPLDSHVYPSLQVNFMETQSVRSGEALSQKYKRKEKERHVLLQLAVEIVN